MKEIITDSVKKLLTDKYLLAVLSGLVALAVIFAIIIGLNVHPRDLRLPSHYSAFGITHFYFDQWFYLLVFVIFGIVAAVLHSAISVKLLIVKGHPLAMAFAWSGVGVVLLGFITALAVLNVQQLL